MAAWRSVAVGWALLALLVLPPAASAARAPKKVATIPLLGAQPLGVAVYEKGNALFVTDDNSGELLKIDGTTNAIVDRAPVGSAAFDVVVNETLGKVVVASDRECCTTGIREGNGLISIVDAETGALQTQIDPAEGSLAGDRQANSYQLASDDAHGKVYVTFFCPFCDGLGVIDLATNTYTVIPGGADLRSDSGIAVNPVTNEAFIPEIANNRIVIVDGATLTTESFKLRPTGGRSPLEIAVNEVENKLYLTMLHVPRQGEIGILILDRDTGRHKFVGKDDLEPLAFNPRTNRLFVGVQVGARGAVINGRTDRLRYVKIGDGGFDGIAVRRSSDNAYLASQNETYILNGKSRCTLAVPTGIRERGGLVASGVAINQRTGRIYVSNDDKARKVTVIRDGRVPCRPAAR